ncbi:MAG: hypothetical protein HZB65_01905 [Candidatus Aenigmarchaeota archaeon]|nr:hypothetical protein [Candidatus Aenigmarchaeota archaeon]
MGCKKIALIIIFLFLFTGIALAQNETVQSDASAQTPITSADPCAGISCSPSTQTCADGFQASCQNICSAGSCGSCIPDCSSHEIRQTDTAVQTNTSTQTTAQTGANQTIPSTDTAIDKCAGKSCGIEKTKCTDGFEASCNNICDAATGDCIKCTTNCYGHEITLPICEQTPVFGVDGAGNCKGFQNTCLPQGWSLVDRCPDFDKTCGNMICEIGETKENCPKDCALSSTTCPDPKTMTPDETRMCNEKGGEVIKNIDDKGCFAGYECRELKKKVPICPMRPDDICPDGFLTNGGYDSNNCPRGQTCCGNNRCQSEKNFEGKENIENCAQDCSDVKKLDCPDIEKDKEMCLEAGQRYAKRIGADGCEIIECQSKTDVYKKQETNLPPGCWEEIFEGRKIVRCEQAKKCSRDPRENPGLQKCYNKGGRVEYNKNDPSDCSWVCADDNFENQYIRKEPVQQKICRVGEQEVPCPTGFGFGTSEKQFERCPTREETSKRQQECKEMGMDAEFVREGECFMPNCISKEKKMCAEELDPGIAERIKRECKDAGKAWNMVPDPVQSNCMITVCGEGQGNEFCKKELPSYIFEECKKTGGELFIEKDYDGCIRFSDCVRKGDKSKVTFEDNEFITEVPDATKLLDIAFKLEELKMAIDKLARKTDSIADYYASVGNDAEEGRYRRIADMFEAAKGEVDRIRSDLKNKLRDITVDDIMNIKEDIKYIKEVTIKDIVYYMLSDEGAQELRGTRVETRRGFEFCSDDDKNKFTDCEKQGGQPQSDPSREGCEVYTGCEQGGEAFFRSFITCQKLEGFNPEGEGRGPEININGLEGDTCAIEIIMTKEAMGPEGPPENLLALMGMKYPLKMQCKIPSDKYPLGPDAVFGRGEPDPKIIEQLCTGDLAKLMQFKPPGEQRNDYRAQEPSQRLQRQEQIPERQIERTESVERTTSTQSSRQACSGCLNNGVCDVGECSDCSDCIR